MTHVTTFNLRVHYFHFLQSFSIEWIIIEVCFCVFVGMCECICTYICVCLTVVSSFSISIPRNQFGNKKKNFFSFSFLSSMNQNTSTRIAHSQCYLRTFKLNRSSPSSPQNGILKKKRKKKTNFVCQIWMRLPNETRQ